LRPKQQLPSQRRKGEKIKTQALQDAILNSAYFSSIATDEKGVIQIFTIGAERMLGYAASDVIDQITPAGRVCVDPLNPPLIENC